MLLGNVMQSRKHSALEAIANVVVGYGVAVASNVLVLPLFGYHTTVADSAAIGAVFTIISLVRSYALRRAFNRLCHKN